MTDARPPARTIRLRYPGTCRACRAALARGARATYDPATRAVVCLGCGDVADERSADLVQPVAAPTSTERMPRAERVAASDLESGTAGASARREHERRVARREERIKQRHPRLGGLILAVTDDPTSTQVWARGAHGEEVLGRRLDELYAAGVRLLHDRRIPGSRANIDHVAVSPAGVFVVDAKRYVDRRPHLRIEGGLLRPRAEKLMVGTRDRTKLLDGMRSQIAAVRVALDEAGQPDVPVRGMLCFIDADWPLFGGSFAIGGIDVLWPKKAAEIIGAAPGGAPVAVDTVHRALAAALRPA